MTTDTFSVFVGQLNQNEVTEDLLYQKFGEYGTIESLQLINKTGSSPFMASGASRLQVIFNYSHIGNRRGSSGICVHQVQG